MITHKNEVLQYSENKVSYILSINEKVDFSFIERKLIIFHVCFSMVKIQKYIVLILYIDKIPCIVCRIMLILRPRTLYMNLISNLDFAFFSQHCIFILRFITTKLLCTQKVKCMPYPSRRQ